VVSTVLLPLSLFCVENHVFLSHGVQVTSVIWWAVTRIVAGVEDHVQSTRDDQAQVGYSVVRPSRGLVTLCAICNVHEERVARVSWFGLETKVYNLLVVWPQNH
jgi:hypothetical protein